MAVLTKLCRSFALTLEWDSVFPTRDTISLMSATTFSTWARMSEVICQFSHTQHDHIGTVLVLRSQFSDNGNAVQNGIAGCLDLFYGGHHSVKVGFDTVGHGTVGLVQMADGHDIADVTQDDTGQLQLVILHIGSTVKAQHVAVDGSAHNDQRVDDTAVDHEFPVLIQDQ